MRGLLRGLVTRAYIPDDTLNLTDPILQLIDPAQRGTLILQRSQEPPDLFIWEIHTQGEVETVEF
jgi:protocatechuate 3,4-dioxygenase, alpha subunit